MKLREVVTTIVAVPLAGAAVTSRYRAGARVIVSVLVEVHTDEGLVGLGEAPPVLGADLTAAIVQSAADLIRGENPLHVNQIMKMLYATYNLAHVHPHAANWALNSLDMALWDLAGKTAGRPLYELWGGPFRREVAYYGHVERQEPQAMAQVARHLAASGFDTLYTKVGLDRDDDLAAVAALREGAPSPHVKIRVDANQSWSPAEAITMINAMAPYGLEFVDQPVLMFNLDALRRVREGVTVPIAAHESGWTMYEVLNVIKAQAADVLHIDPRFDLGLSGARISAGMAEAAGLPVVAHSFGELGIAFSANMQLVAACPNFTLANQEDGYRELTDDVLVGGPIPFRGSVATVPEGPGLGVTLDPARVKEYQQYYQREVRARRQDRALNTTLYKAMYLRPQLKNALSSGSG